MSKINKTNIEELEGRVSALEEAIKKLSKVEKPVKKTTNKKDK